MSGVPDSVRPLNPMMPIGDTAMFNNTDAQGNPIPVGAIITSRPYDEEGVGTTPTGIVAVNADGEPVDASGNKVDIEDHPERAAGHISTGGTFDTLYNPILGDTPLKR